jgi:N-acetylmuramoyl-L-alanine amidase
MDKYILIFDYGHGTRKYTKGKCAPDGSLYEGEWNREVGKMIVEGMRELGVDVREIITGDEDTPLQKRCDLVNRIVKDNPDAKCRFISIHINAAPDPGWSNASGASVYVCVEPSQESIKMAQCYYDMVEEFKLKGNRNVPEDRVWKANYKVLRSTNCPAILTENLFMTNHKEVEFLLSDEGKETICNMHICALCKYMGIPYAICKA